MAYLAKFDPTLNDWRNTTNTMNTKHTPGPWHVDRDAFERAARLRGGDNMRLILRWDAFARRGSIEAEANARLIAAAPELAAVCEKLVYLWGAGIRPQVIKGMLREEQEFAQLIDAARAAIAKATNP